MKPINYIPLPEVTELSPEDGRKQWALAQNLADRPDLREWSAEDVKRLDATLSRYYPAK